LTSGVGHDVDERVERLVVEGLLCHSLANLLCASSDFGHVELEVSDNLLEGVSAASYDLLDDVTEVVDQEVERLSVLRDRSEKAINCTDHFPDQVGDVSDQTDQERVQVQRVKDTLNDRDQVAQSYNQLEFNIYISNSDVDLLHGDLNTSIDLDETGDLCVEVKICLKLLDT